MSELQTTATEFQSTGFEMIHCPKCGAANTAGSVHCRKCNIDMNKASEFVIPIWIVAATVGIILLFTATAIATRLSDYGLFFAAPLILIACIMVTVGNIWFLVVAFKESVMWGLGCIFLPFISFIFFFKFMDRAAKPVGLSAVGGFIIVITGFIVSSALPTIPPGF